MNIYAQKGHKIVFCHPENGYSSDQEQAAKLLKINHVYTVERTVVHRSSTDVELQEVPGEMFNSVLFEDLR